MATPRTDSPALASESIAESSTDRTMADGAAVGDDGCWAAVTVTAMLVSAADADPVVVDAVAKLVERWAGVGVARSLAPQITGGALQQVCRHWPAEVVHWPASRKTAQTSTSSSSASSSQGSHHTGPPSSPAPEASPEESSTASSAGGPVGDDVGNHGVDDPEVGNVVWACGVCGAAVGVNCSHTAVSSGDATTTATIRIVSQMRSNELGLRQSSIEIAICSVAAL